MSSLSTTKETPFLIHNINYLREGIDANYKLTIALRDRLRCVLSIEQDKNPTPEVRARVESNSGNLASIVGELLSEIQRNNSTLSHILDGLEV